MHPRLLKGAFGFCLIVVAEFHANSNAETLEVSLWRWTVISGRYGCYSISCLAVECHLDPVGAVDERGSSIGSH